MSRYLFVVVTLVVGNVYPALGQSADKNLSGFIALGPALVPEYEGADQYRLLPFAVADFHVDDLAVELRGTRLRVDLLSRPGVVGGPVLNVRLSRGDGVGGRVALLAEIDTSIEAGAFLGLRYGGNENGEGAVQFDVTVLADVSDSHEGVTVTTGVSYAALRRAKLLISLDAQVTYGNAKYIRTYYGVTTDGAMRSGLREYHPESSFRDIALGTTVGYRFSRHWGVLGRASYAYLIGDPADSPIVRDEGSRHQIVVGMGLSYRF